MARQNQGYRRDLNLIEGTDDLKAWSALAGSGISDDLNRLQNNLRNTSKVGFNTVDGSGFFNFDIDRPLSVSSIISEGTENFIAGRLLSETEITVTMDRPYYLKFGDLIGIENVTGVGSTILNNTFAVERVLVGFTTFTCKKIGVAYTSTNVSDGLSLSLKANDTFAFTKDDVVGVDTSVTIEVKDSSNNVIGVNTLSPSIDYYVTESDGFTKFKLSTRPSTNVLGVNVINVTSNQIGISTVVSPDNFTFVRKDPVHQTQILNYITPVVQDDELFTWLGGQGINASSDITQANIENAQFFMNRKYRGDKSTTTSEELKFEGGIVLNDPDEFNDGATAVLTGGKAGIYIGDTRAFSTDNNPWSEEGNADGTGTLQTESTSVSIGELSFFDKTNGPIIIEGIASDITTVSPEIDASNFSHKLPIQVKDPDGNTETYFLLLTTD